MNVIDDIIKVDSVTEPTVVALGIFDGVHIGHQLIVNEVKKIANEKKMKSAVFTFTRHPAMLLHNKKQELILSTREEKIEYFRALDIDFLLFTEFDDRFRDLQAEEFIKNIVLKKIKADTIVIGSDYRFGAGAAGNVEKLRVFGEKYGFSVIVIPRYNLDEYEVSSSAIRKLIAAGKVKEAALLLNRTYDIHGKVVHGAQLGTKLGFPTANMQISQEKVVPSNGVYVVLVRWNDREFFGVANIGLKPTFDGKERWLEVHILEFDEDVYGEELSIGFLDRLRGEIAFKKVDSLVDQIKHDISDANDIIAKTLHT